MIKSRPRFSILALSRLPPNSRKQITIYIIIVVLIFALYLILSLWSLSERSRAIQSSENSLEQVTSAVSEQTVRLFKLTEMSLLSLSDWQQRSGVEYPGEDPDFIALVGRMRHLTGNLIEYRLINNKGDIFLIPTTGHLPASNVFNIEAYKVQRNSTTKGLYISDPLKSPVDGKWIIPITYPIIEKSGGTSVISAVIDIDEIVKIFERQRIKPSGSITIIKINGTTLLRSPIFENSVRKSIAMSKDFIEHFSKNDQGLYQIAGAYDGVERIICFKKIPEYGLIIATTTTLDDALKNWQRQTWIIGCTVSLSIAVIAILILRVLTKIHKAEAAERLSSEKFSKAFLCGPDAMIISEIKTGLIYEINSSFTRVFGYSADEVLGRTTIEIGLWADSCKRKEAVLPMEQLGCLQN